MAFNFGLKRFSKQDPNEKLYQSYLPDISGSIYFYGKIGSGKTTSLMSLTQKFHDTKGYKVFDIYGGERNEHLFWCFPSNDKNYWDSAKKLMNLDKDGPKQYKIHLIYPYYKSMIPKKLPFDTPNIKSSVFTIPFMSLDVEDIYLATGILSDSDKFVLRQTLEDIKKKDGPRMIQYTAKKYSTKIQNIYRNFIMPLTNNMLLTSSTADTNFDIKKELYDKETITVLCTEFVPKEFRLMVIGWFVRQMSKALDNSARRTRNILIMREVAEFFRATDDSIMPDSYKIFRKQLANFVRYGRKGIHFFFDAQSPSETKGIVEGQSDFIMFGKLPGENDRMVGTDQMRRDGLISQKQIARLGILNPGEIMFCESGKTAKLRYVPLPRTMYWKPGSGNFYKHIWPKYNDRWKNFEEIYDEMQVKWKLEDEIVKQEEELKRIKEAEAKNKAKAKSKKPTKQDEYEMPSKPTPINNLPIPAQETFKSTQPQVNTVNNGNSLMSFDYSDLI
jgi:hypothetical protein